MSTDLGNSPLVRFREIDREDNRDAIRLRVTVPAAWAVEGIQRGQKNVGGGGGDRHRMNSEKDCDNFIVDIGGGIGVSSISSRMAIAALSPLASHRRRIARDTMC